MLFYLTNMSISQFIDKHKKTKGSKKYLKACE